jgi:hypothetical protein
MPLRLRIPPGEFIRPDVEGIPAYAAILLFRISCDIAFGGLYDPPRYAYNHFLRRYETVWCQPQTMMAYILTWNQCSHTSTNSRKTYPTLRCDNDGDSCRATEYARSTTCINESYNGASSTNRYQRRTSEPKPFTSRFNISESRSQSSRRL